MLYLFKYLFLSENKAVYRHIAQQHKVSALLVYRLAHGKKARNNKEYMVLKNLRKAEIIEGVV